MKKSILLLLSLTLSLGVFAQKKKKKEDPAIETADSSQLPKKEEKKKEEKGPKSFETFVDSTFTSQIGLYGVHFKEDKWYFEIADSLLGREIMSVSRYAQTAAGGNIYGGELVNRQVVKWEKGPGDKLFLKSLTYVVTSPDSTRPIFKAVTNSNADPIVAAFDIKALKKDSSNRVVSFVVDVTSTFDGDEQVFSLSSIDKQRFNITSLKSDRSYIESIKTYPINTEIKTVKTFAVTPPRIQTGPPSPGSGTYLPASRDAGVVTMQFNTSMVLLPKVPMQKRAFDARVGYFANQYEKFEEDSQRADKEVFAVRWRLEPKSSLDAARQKAGELIEPKKPIVYYIDPATPDRWKPYIKMGIDDWNVAFEEAGWKNAIRGEYWPEDDSTMSLEDARFSVVRYFASPIPNAYGPNVHDPRSGEILESHIGWYHNVMKLLRNWYLIQTAAVDEGARKMRFDDALMGDLIRFVSSHEVGHTLGLRHNMGASSATSVDSLRSNSWLTAHGHTSSIMDYARFNYVAQPEDSVTRQNLYPRIGPYDKWAIKWGYSYFPDSDETGVRSILNQWTKEAYEDPFKRFGTETSPYDPRYQTEDLGNDAMKASLLGIKNLQRIIGNLKSWSNEPGESYDQLHELHGEVVTQFRRYMAHVTKNIGGVYDTPKTYDMEGNQFVPVPETIQKRAVSFLNEQVFQTPEWLYPVDILANTRIESGSEALKSLQSQVLGLILDKNRLARLLEFEAKGDDYYSVDELLADLETGIISEIKRKTPVPIHRRNLQKVYIDKLIELLNPGKGMIQNIPVGVTYGFDNRTVDLDLTDLPSVVRGHLVSIKSGIQPLLSIADKPSRYHYQDLLQRIERSLDPK